MLARLIARSVVALGDSFAVSRAGASVGIWAPASACPSSSSTAARELWSALARSAR